MPCPRCRDSGAYENYDTVLRRREALLCTCDAGLAMRFPLLTREQIKKRGLDVETWKMNGEPPKR